MPRLKTTPMVVFSAALVLAGLDVEAQDVDLELHPLDFQNIAPEVTEMRQSPCGNLLGYYKKIKVAGIEVELTSESKVRKTKFDGTSYWKDIEYRRNAMYHRIDNLIIPYHHPRAQLDLYKDLGREKDRVKIELLKKHLGSRW